MMRVVLGGRRYVLTVLAYIGAGLCGPFIISHALQAYLQPAIFLGTLQAMREVWPMEAKLACLNAVPFLAVVALARPGAMSAAPRDPRFNRRCGVLSAGCVVAALAAWVNLDVWARVWSEPVDPKAVWDQVGMSLWALGGAPLSVMTLFAEPVWALASLPFAFGLGYLAGGIIRRRRRSRRAWRHRPGKPPGNPS